MLVVEGGAGGGGGESNYLMENFPKLCFKNFYKSNESKSYSYIIKKLL
jgi:hypothetical protein